MAKMKRRTVGTKAMRLNRLFRWSALDAPRTLTRDRGFTETGVNMDHRVSDVVISEGLYFRPVMTVLVDHSSRQVLGMLATYKTGSVTVKEVQVAIHESFI